MRKINIYLSILIVLFCISVYAKPNYISDIVFERFEDDSYVSQRPSSLTSEDIGVIEWEPKRGNIWYDVCFDFPIGSAMIEFDSIEEVNLGIFREEKVKAYEDFSKICFDDIKGNKRLDIKLRYRGEGVVKYNVTFIPSIYEHDYEAAIFNGDIIQLDPYLIGDLENSDKLILKMPFTNNLNTYRNSTFNYFNASWYINGTYGYDFKVMRNTKDMFILGRNASTRGITWTNRGAAFNGTASVVNMTRQYFVGNAFTIVTRFFVNSTNTVETLFYSYNLSMGNDNVIQMFVAPKVSCVLYDKAYSVNNRRKYYNGATTITPFQEYQAACVWDGTNLKVYLNGAENTPYSVTSDDAVVLNDSVREALIGVSGETYTFNGTISDMIIYNRSLSAYELGILYSRLNVSSGTLGVDNYYANISQDNWFSVKNESSINFEGTDYTLSLWINTTQTTRQNIIHKMDSNHTGWYLDMLADGRLLYVTNQSYGGPTGQAAYMRYSQSPVNNGSWFNVIVKVASNVPSIYINGNLSNGAASGNIPYGNGTSNIYIGKPYRPEVAAFRGMFDELLIFNTALSDYNISLLYNGFSSMINLTFVDEITNASVVNITLKVQSDSYSKNYSTATNNIYFNDAPIGEILTLRYKADGYFERFYYLNLTSLLNNITLYLPNNETASEQVLTVYDEIIRPIEGAYVAAYRYNIILNDYDKVEMCKTDVNGQCRLHLFKNNEFYKFRIYYPFGNLKTETNNFYIYSDTLEFQISLNTIPLANYDSTTGITFNLEYLNATDKFSVSYVDSKEQASSYTLKVYQQTPITSKTLLSTNTSSSSTGQMQLFITPVNDTTYIAEFQAVYGTDAELLDTEVHIEPKYNMGREGLFLVLILSFIMPFLASWSLGVAVLLCPIPLIIGALIGIVPAYMLGITIFLWVMSFIVYILLGDQG